MSKRFLSVIAAGALISSVFTALPAKAETPIPATVQIDDPALDANTLGGDQVTPAGNVSNVGDLRKIWFSNTPETISVHIQTTIAPPASAVGILYTVLATPGEGAISKQAAGCLQFRVFIPASNAGGTYQGKTWTKVLDRCNDGTVFVKHGVEGEAVIEALGDGTGLTTLTFPRSYSTLFADGAAISAPTGRSDALVGTDKVITPETPATNPAHPWSGYRYDDTKVGTDYTIASGGAPSEPPAAEEPKEEKPEPKGCKKGKGKKKGCGKDKGEKPAEGCAAYTPGEEGAEAENLVVTDANTAEAPLEITIEQEMALGGPLLNGVPPDQTSHAFKNLQVDSAASDAGLFIRYEFPEYEDHDLYVNYADGTEAAHVGGFNAAPVSVFDGTGAGGHSEHGAEQIDGLRTPDCGGYTVDFSNFLGEGGEYTVLVWLGEVQNEPAAPEKAVK